jgi:hypothetical protein
MLNKKDVAIIAGPFVGALVFAAANVAAVKVVEYRAKRRQPKDSDVITDIMKEAQK